MTGAKDAVKVGPDESSSPLVKTTISLVALQLVSRLFSFSLNQLLLRSTTPQALGVATMGLEVVRDTGLFLLREGVRGAVVRTRNSSSEATPAKRTLLSQTLFLPTLLSPLLPLLFLAYSFLPPTPLPALFLPTIALYATSGVLELISERWYLDTLREWETLTGLRVRIEGIAVGLKAVGTLATILIGGERWALLAFGVGQVVYGATLLVCLGWCVGRRSERWTMVKVEVGSDSEGRTAYFDPEIKELSWALTKQSLVKQFLTEGDKIVVGRLSKVEDQGGYAVALNYGSLIARILFQPLEESSRLYISRTLALPTPTSLLSASSLLSSLLLLHTHLTLIFLLLAPSYTSPLLFHLLGPRWSFPRSSAPAILRAYCSYLPFLAINGVTEAFFQSVADEAWLRRGSAWMMLCSAGFVGAVVLGARMGMGEVGLVYANCVNMALRIGFSSYFIRGYFSAAIGETRVGEKEVKEIKRNISWRSWMPKVGTVVAFALASLVVRWSESRDEWRSLRGMGEHVALGAVCGVVCLGVVYMAERDSLVRLKNVLRRKAD